MGEVPWPDAPVDAHLDWDGADGWLHFVDPHGNRAAVPVTSGPSVQEFNSPWHLDLCPDDLAIVSPSIHHVGFFHTPNPCRFRIVPRAEPADHH